MMTIKATIMARRWAISSSEKVLIAAKRNQARKMLEPIHAPDNIVGLLVGDDLPRQVVELLLCHDCTISTSEVTSRLIRSMRTDRDIKSLVGIASTASGTRNVPKLAANVTCANRQSKRFAWHLIVCDIVPAMAIAITLRMVYSPLFSDCDLKFAAD